MSSYKELQEDFNRKVEELKKNCKHPKLSEWMDEWWAMAHSTGFEVQICEVCNTVLHRRTLCSKCSISIQDEEIHEGDGTDRLPIGVYYCQKCAEPIKKKVEKDLRDMKEAGMIDEKNRSK